jgi:uncharacterized protein YecE (DUF72 family)
MIRVGTSGYSYTDWVGPVYPAGTRPDRMLDLYCRRFSTVEINSTYYRLPGARMFDSLVRRSPDGFLFTVKLPGDVTHGGDLACAASFREVVRPLVDAGRFGCALAQFPFAFRNTGENRAYLARLHDALSGMAAAVEFRHESWQIPAVRSFLQGHGFGTACVDQPDLPGLMRREAWCTAGLGYVRFHGRNRRKWFEHERAIERYDYLYTKDELAGWLPGIRKLSEDAREVFVFFNNHASGQAVSNASDLVEMLAEAPSPSPSGGPARSGGRRLKAGSLE